MGDVSECLSKVKRKGIKLLFSKKKFTIFTQPDFKIYYKATIIKTTWKKLEIAFLKALFPSSFSSNMKSWEIITPVFI